MDASTNELRRAIFGEPVPVGLSWDDSGDQLRALCLVGLHGSRVPYKGLPDRYYLTIPVSIGGQSIAFPLFSVPEVAAIVRANYHLPLRPAPEAVRRSRRFVGRLAQYRLGGC